MDQTPVEAGLANEVRFFWTYASPFWAGWFLGDWCTRAFRSRRPALLGHRDIIPDWFRA